MSESYNVVFSGELLDGFDLESVQKAFADIFKLNQTKVNSYFTGQSKLLKKEVTLDIAKKYQSRIESVGGKIEIQPVFKQASIDNEVVLESDVSLKKETGLTKASQITPQEIPVKTKPTKVVVEQKQQDRRSEEVNKPDYALDDSMNAIEIGRLNQIRKMQKIELADDKSSKTLMFFGFVLLLLGIADLTLELLSIFSLSGTFASSISMMLVGLVFIKSSKAS